MKILITGASGFVGKNLTAELKNRGHKDIFEYDKGTELALLDHYCQKADFVFHLAGVNRPLEQAEYMEGNYGFTLNLLEILKVHRNNCPVMLSSSIQAVLDNPYGKSKKAGEDLLFRYGDETGSRILVYRLPNVFGKWSQPNYNSAVATFCHNIARGLPIVVNDPEVALNLVYIDDVIEELLSALEGRENRVGNFCAVPVVHRIELGELVNLLYSFKESRETKAVPDLADEFTRKLYSTYLSFLPVEQFSYGLKMNFDDRGSFTEFIRTPDRGQVSVNVSKPRITKGNHWHHSKNEKFLVVRGRGVIRFRKVGSDKVIEYHVSGERMEVVEVPPGYTHNIENVGEEDMVTIMWANEPYEPEKPDTYYLEV